MSDEQNDLAVPHAQATEWERLGIRDGRSVDICAGCVGDPFLGEFISKGATKSVCTYCGKAGDVIARPLSEVVQYVAERISKRFTHTDVGDYQAASECRKFFPTFHYLMQSIDFEPGNPSVAADIETFFDGRRWYRRGDLTSADHRESGWKSFRRVVMHSRRYTFASSRDGTFPEGHPGYMPPGKILQEIGAVVAGLGFIEELPRGAQFWRAQPHRNGRPPQAPREFTSAPVSAAVAPNRMSPAGIPMFYGAEDFDTAFLEIAPTDAPLGWRASAVRFESLRTLRILNLAVDLAQKRRAISFFAPDGPEWRDSIEFLQFFVKDVSQPLPADLGWFRQRTTEAQVHIEYVPTQVFTEYVRFEMPSDGGKIDGIRYPSSRTGRPCYLLFLDQDDCLELCWGHEQSLRWIPGLRKEAVIEHVERTWHFEDFSEEGQTVV